jgi:hypothetical protein
VPTTFPGQNCFFCVYFLMLEFCCICDLLSLLKELDPKSLVNFLHWNRWLCYFYFLMHILGSLNESINLIIVNICCIDHDKIILFLHLGPMNLLKVSATTYNAVLTFLASVFFFMHTLLKLLWNNLPPQKL